MYLSFILNFKQDTRSGCLNFKVKEIQIPMKNTYTIFFILSCCIVFKAFLQEIKRADKRF